MQSQLSLLAFFLFALPFPRPPLLCRPVLQTVPCRSNWKIIKRECNIRAAKSSLPAKADERTNEGTRQTRAEMMLANCLCVQIGRARRRRTCLLAADAARLLSGARADWADQIGLLNGKIGAPVPSSQSNSAIGKDEKKKKKKQKKLLRPKYGRKLAQRRLQFCTKNANSVPPQQQVANQRI